MRGSEFKTTQRLPVEPGMPLVVDLHGVAKRLNCTFAGLQADQCLIVRLPILPDRELGVKDDGKATVRFISSGRVFGFRSRVAGHYHKDPLSFVFLDYPAKVEVVELRKGQRINCLWPASVLMGANTCGGIVVDIGPGGVSFMHPITAGKQPPPVKLGDLVTLRVSLMGLEGTQSIRCQVRNLKLDSAHLALGLEFANIEPELLAQIKSYVETVTNMLGQDET